MDSRYCLCLRLIESVGARTKDTDIILPYGTYTMHQRLRSYRSHKFADVQTSDHDLAFPNDHLKILRHTLVISLLGMTGDLHIHCYTSQGGPARQLSQTLALTLDMARASISPPPSSETLSIIELDTNGGSLPQDR